MKANERCQEQFQGDRCNRELGHEGEHVGNFHAWDGQERKRIQEEK